MTYKYKYIVIRGVMVDVIEKEISIKIPLEECIENIEEYPRSIVVYYNNDIRISNGIQQIKRTNHKDCYLKWYNNYFLPCVYTISTEQTTNYDLLSLSLKKIITRFTLYEEHDMRITIEFENDGYFLKGETENLDEIKKFYEKFTTFMRSTKCMNVYDKIEINSYNSITSRSFGLFTIGDELTCVGIKFKYDGYKGKLIVGDSCCYLTRPVGNLIQKIIIPNLQKFKNFVFQVECMDEKIILTDVIGIYINGTLFTPGPIDVMSFFLSLNLNEDPPKVIVDDKLFSVYTQHYITESGQMAIDKYDGFIYVSEHKEYKVKLPTIDLELRNKFFYYHDEIQKQTSDFQYDYEDGIYEVMHHPHDHNNMYRFLILRHRFDRQYASNKNEYNIFIAANQTWSQFDY